MVVRNDSERMGEDNPLGVCRTLEIDSENVTERGQILTTLPAHSGTMSQGGGEI